MSENPVNRYRFVIEALMIPSRMSMALVTAAIGPILPLIMQELDIGRGTVSWFVSAPQLLTVVLAVPSGIMASRIGLKRTFVIGSFLEATGVLAPFLFNYPMLLLSRILFGVGLAMTGPVAAGIIAQWFSRKEMPLANGINSALASLAQTFSRFVTIPIVAFLTWRGALAGYSAIILLTATLWMIIGREKPAGSPTSRLEPSPPKEMQPAKSRPVSPAKMGTWQILRQRETLILAFCLMGAFGLFFTLAFFGEISH